MGRGLQKDTDERLTVKQRLLRPQVGQSDAGSTGIFSQWTNQTQKARLHSHDGPIGLFITGRGLFGC